MGWRFGDGSAVGLAAQRALTGALLLSPVILGVARRGQVGAMLTNKAAATSIVCGGLSMPFTAVLFRELTGPQAALVTAVTPACVLAVAMALRHQISATVAFLVALASVVGTAAAVVGGLGAFSPAGLGAAAALTVIGVVAIMSTAAARRQFGAGALVAFAMLGATIGCFAVAFAVDGPQALPASGFLTATFVGVTATIARVLHTQVLAHVGAPMASAGTYVTAFVTGVGGLVIFDDAIDTASAALVLAAAALAGLAMVKGNAYGNESAERKAAARAL